MVNVTNCNKIIPITTPCIWNVLNKMLDINKAINDVIPKAIKMGLVISITVNPILKGKHRMIIT